MAKTKKPVKKSKVTATKKSVKKVTIKPARSKTKPVAIKKTTSKIKSAGKPIKAKGALVKTKKTIKISKPVKEKKVISKNKSIVKPKLKKVVEKKKPEKGKKIMIKDEKNKSDSNDKKVVMKETTKTEKKDKPKESIEITYQIDHVQIPSIFKGDSPEDAAKYSIEKKLIALYSLQQIDSQIDKIQIVRGELPLEVQDLEDSVVGLETRVENYQQEITTLEKDIHAKQNTIKEANALIKKYKDQKNNVRNNREYDSLTKEIEYQTLEIQLCEKKINEFKQSLDAKKEAIIKVKEEFKELKNDLDIKKKELKEITSETEKEESELIKKSKQNQKYIEERLFSAYSRIRKNARNGLAVVKIERDACGGCFNKIPPQRQMEIQMHKKIIVCEYCGRVLVDEDIAEAVKKA